MSRKSVQVVAVAGCLALVVTAVWWTSAGERTPSRSAAAGPGSQMVGGIQGRESSSARRTERTPSIDPAPELEPAAADVEPEPDEPVAAERSARTDEVVMAPAMVVTDEMRAAEAAHAERTASVAAEVRAQVASQRAALRSACWTPELRGAVEAAAFMVSASFNAEGEVVSHGLSELRSGPGVAGAPGVGQCLRTRGIELEGVGPGASVTVEVPLTLP